MVPVGRTGAPVNVGLARGAFSVSNIAVKVQQDGMVAAVELPQENELEFLQGVVGGWVQAVPLSGAFEGMVLWVNEEGKFDSSLRLNTIATDFWVQSYGNTDFIMGNALITGEADDEGETLGLTPTQASTVMSMALVFAGVVVS
jgi:hypothetical protein